MTSTYNNLPTYSLSTREHSYSQSYFIEKISVTTKMKHTKGCNEALGWSPQNVDGIKKCFKYVGESDHIDAMKTCCNENGILPSPTFG